MDKKSKRKLSDKENCSPSSPAPGKVPLNSTVETDIIECSILSDNKYMLLSQGKGSVKKTRSTQALNTPVQTRELRSSFKSSNDVLRLSLRKSYGLEDDPIPDDLQFQTPFPSKTPEGRNSIIKKLISTIKKTPTAPLLSKSKLRNIEQWLNENDVETVITPPFANLSVTPVNSIRKRLSNKWKEKKKTDVEESSVDSEVEGVLKAVYGDNWKQKNVQNRAKTEPKKKPAKLFTPATSTRKRIVNEFESVRRNILRGKKLNLFDEESEKNSLNDSVVSGVKMINLDSSGCSDERTKANLIKVFNKKRKNVPIDSSFDSIEGSPVEKKKPKLTPGEKVSTKKTSSKKIISEAPPKTPKKTFLASLSVSTPNSKCHPDAQYYKVNFKARKEELVKKLYKLYNSEVFEGKLAEDMNFSWNVKLRGTAGYCYNKRITKSTGEIIRLSRIEFSTKIVDRADRLRDTMIHELCHAASWVIDGVLDGHGQVWTKWASRAMDRFSELPMIKRCHNYDIVSKYVYRCTGCGYSIKRHSKSINTDRKRCGHCYGVLELLINKKKRGKGEVPEFDTTRTLPTPNKFALFVKENYHTVKSSRANAKHSEIMKALGEQYALLKNGSKSAKKLESK